MFIRICRDKVWGFYPFDLPIYIDGKRIAKLGHGQSLDITLPPGGRSLSVKWGFFHSRPFDLSKITDGATLSIRPIWDLSASEIMFIALAYGFYIGFFGVEELFAIGLILGAHSLVFRRENWLIEMV